ncbi:MAG: amidase [Candidatus Eremiobacter antarcticus]|nr:amidase [Candidatus Eremiobacteraeota bacterium]MBC5807110.1 amidase [Candidatus Eremiobacteraeota bacterium]PZR62416.1 MAG: amidase [Candidatus Eremiobacter sp. RRmetagenome_bin22]
MRTDEPAFQTIPSLGKMLRARQISSVELAKYCLDRLARLGPRLHSVAALMPSRALQEAKAADAELAAGKDRGPLHGIPYGAKDLFAARGAPTTWGAAPYRRQVFDSDATVVRRLHDAGAVLVAKLAMIELAGGMGYNEAGASLTGACRTPWSLDHWSGGSSSGSAASVSAGLVPFAIGSETDGSIMNPASYCGVTGLRPTYGLVSRHGAMALSWTLDKVGPFCRSAQDADLVLNAMAGRDPLDRTSVDTPARNAAPSERKTWRIGVPAHVTDKVQPEVRHNFEAALRVLGTMGTVEHIALPDFPYNAMIGAVISGEAGSAFRDIIEDGRVQSLASPLGRRGGYSSLTISAVDYIDAMRRRPPLRSAFAKIFETVDVLVGPTYSTVSYPIDLPFDKAYPGTDDGPFITACNLAGIPAISVPSGFGHLGLPTGLMIAGPAFAEPDIVALAARFQRQTAFHHKRPPVAVS